MNYMYRVMPLYYWKTVFEHFVSHHYQHNAVVKIKCFGRSWAQHFVSQHYLSQHNAVAKIKCLGRSWAQHFVFANKSKLLRSQNKLLAEIKQLTVIINFLWIYILNIHRIHPFLISVVTHQQTLQNSYNMQIVLPLYTGHNHTCSPLSNINHMFHRQ